MEIPVLVFWFSFHGLPSPLRHVSQRGRSYVALILLMKRGEKWKHSEEKREERREKSREQRIHSRRNPEERGSVIRSRSSLLSMVAGQCCRTRGRERSSLRRRRLFSLPSLTRARGGAEQGHVACPPRTTRVRSLAAATSDPDPRTMRHATPGVTPPPRSGATATRYAPYTRYYMRGSERAASVWDTIVEELSRRKPGTRIFPPHGEILFTSSRCECVYHILCVLLYKK